jgi:hypothetical protein
MSIKRLALFARTVAWVDRPVYMPECDFDDEVFDYNEETNLDDEEAVCTDERNDCDDEEDDDYPEEYQLTKGGDEKIVAVLKKLLSPHGIELYSFESDELDAEASRLLRKADEVILAVDARFPVHREAFRCAERFLNYTEPGDAAPWAPYLLLTNADLVSPAGLQTAAGMIRECWLMMIPSLSDIRCSYPVIYCSHDYNHFSLDGVNYEDGIDVVLNYMTEKQDYWNKHRKWAQGN